MDRRPTSHFKGYDIFTFAIPTNDGRWTGSSEIQKISAQGDVEISQHFSGPYLADSNPEARALACHAAEHKIIEIIADPLLS